MKNLAYVLIFLFASPAFAGGSYLDGPNSSEETPIVVQDNPVVEKKVPATVSNNPVTEKKSEFKINEALYLESMGSNGYYGGGFYGEERNQAQIPYYTITSRGGESNFISGVVVAEGQILPLNFVSPFVAPFGFGFFPGDVSVNIGSFSFLSGGFGRGTFGHGGFGHGGGFGGGSFGFRHR